MKKVLVLLAALWLAQGLLQAQFYKREQPLAHTYSIVAYDPETGQIGAAVQSHWFSVGTVVIWGKAGVGAVATQSLANPSFGPDGLAMLELGLTPEQAVQLLTGKDEGAAYRQLALINASGQVAAFTGAECIEAAGHQTGKNYSVQANLMDKATVWPAMAKAFETTKGSLAERMMAALEAAQAEGGDIRGKQSAALLVVNAEATGQPWVDRAVDLRVDDHPEPLKELRRLLGVQQAYAHMNAGDEALGAGNLEEALKEYSAAEALMPENDEMKFWHAVSLANVGRVEESLPLFAQAYKANKGWKVLIPRLVKNGMLGVDAQAQKQIEGAK